MYLAQDLAHSKSQSRLDISSPIVLATTTCISSSLFWTLLGWSEARSCFIWLSLSTLNKSQQLIPESWDDNHKFLSLSSTSHQGPPLSSPYLLALLPFLCACLLKCYETQPVTVSSIELSLP